MLPTILYPTINRFPLERANGIQVVNTCHALAEKGCRVYLFVLKSSAQTTEECLKFYGLEPSDNFHIIRMPFIRSTKSNFLWNVSAYMSCFLHLYFFLRKIKNPVILTRDLFVARNCLRRARSGRVKLIYECHHVEYMFREEMHELYHGASLLSETKIKRIKAKESKVYHHVSGIITITQKLKEMIQEKFNVDTPVAVVPDGSCAPERTENGAQNRSFADSGKIKNLLYVGDLNPVRGVDVILKAVSRVPDVHLTIAGGGEGLGGLGALAGTLGMEKKVRFLGYIPPREVRSLYDTADIVLLPLSNTFHNSYFVSPLKMFEYMVMGKAIIAVDLPAIREILTHEKTALLVHPEDENAWAHAILRLLEDDPFRQTLSANASALAAEYTWDKRAERIVTFMAEISRRVTS